MADLDFTAELRREAEDERLVAGAVRMMAVAMMLDTIDRHPKTPPVTTLDLSVDKRRMRRVLDSAAANALDGY